MKGPDVDNGTLKAADLSDQVTEQLGSTLGPHRGQRRDRRAVRIERKFLVETAPDLDGTERVEIEQAYLAFADGDGGAEVRLRRWGDDLLLTVKAGSGRTRTEDELVLDAERSEALWAVTEGRRVEKTRHLIPHGSLEIELDVFKPLLDGSLLAEVEFPDERTAELQAEAFAYGERLFAEKPKRFVKRVETYWTAKAL